MGAQVPAAHVAKQDTFGAVKILLEVVKRGDRDEAQKQRRGWIIQSGGISESGKGNAASRSGLARTIPRTRCASL